MDFNLQLWDDALFHAANGLVGQSWTFDALLTLSLDNPVVKAGPIGACFLYAWWKPGAPGAVAQRRAVLLVTLVAMFAIAPAMKLASQEDMSPRPFVRAHQVYVLEDGALEPASVTAFTPPKTGDVLVRAERLRRGDLDDNDLVGFPSDHAALFLALATAIAIVAWKAGLIALAWALLVTLAPRVALGMHAPSDILAGGAAGVALLIIVLGLGLWGLRRPVDWLVEQAERHRPWAAALLFLALIEVANAMNTLERLTELATEAIR